ncbi:hypothetical protein DSUL_20575 [Desulfovibrionales bacterium]
MIFWIRLEVCKKNILIGQSLTLLGVLAIYVSFKDPTCALKK